MTPHLPRGIERPDDPAYALEFIRGEGCHLWDIQGNRYIDFVSGYSSLSFGHSHPRLVAAAKDQLNTLVHLVGWNHPWRTELATSLASLAPFQEEAQTWISTTGARAVEIAWKIAYSIRPGALVSFDFAYHGRSIATSQITHTQKLDIPLPVSVAPLARDSRSSNSLPVLEYPKCEACPLELQRESCNAECFDASETWLKSHHENISAVIVEPALGARGYYYAANAFFHRLRTITRALGIILIDDEIQMGMGRLGHMFAAESQGWEPDMIVLGKSLGGGLVNVSAVLGPSSILNVLPRGIESETFAADPLGCRIALEALNLFQEETQHNLAQVSRSLQNGAELLYQRLSEKYGNVPLRIDSQGCSEVIEILARTDEPETFPHILAREWVRKAQANGLLVHWSGKHRERLVLIPPLIASSELINEAFEILFVSYPG